MPAEKVSIPTAMEQCFGVLYDVNVQRHGWPLEIPPVARSDRNLCFTVSDVPISIWICGEQEQAAQLCRPVFAGSALCRSAWAVYSAPNLPDNVWAQNNFTWEAALATNQSQQLGSAIASCANAVLTSLENNLEDVMRMTGNSRNIRNTWRRKCTAVMREMEAAATQSSRFAVGSLDAWLQAMNIDNVWCSRKLKWQEFIRMAPAVPLVTLKPNDTKAFFEYGIEYFSSCMPASHSPECGV